MLALARVGAWLDSPACVRLPRMVVGQQHARGELAEGRKQQSRLESFRAEARR